MNAQYQYPRFWLILFWLYLFLIFGLGLLPHSQFPDLPQSEKILHFSLFLGLGFLLEQLFVESPKRMLLKAFVVAFFIELAQISLPAPRTFAMIELLSCTLGAFVGIVLSARLLPDLLIKIEKRFSAR